jgi:hypothetical protein
VLYSSEITAEHKYQTIMFTFASRPVAPEPAMSLEQVLQESIQHEELIARIKAEVGQDTDEIGVPDSLFSR